VEEGEGVGESAAAGKEGLHLLLSLCDPVLLEDPEELNCVEAVPAAAAVLGDPEELHLDETVARSLDLDGDWDVQAVEVTQ